MRTDCKKYLCYVQNSELNGMVNPSQCLTLHFVLLKKSILKPRGTKISSLSKARTAICFFFPRMHHGKLPCTEYQTIRQYCQYFGYHKEFPHVFKLSKLKVIQVCLHIHGGSILQTPCRHENHGQQQKNKKNLKNQFKFLKIHLFYFLNLFFIYPRSGPRKQCLAAPQ